EASHMGDLAAKVTAIERFDADVVGTIREGLPSFGEHKILILPDHPNPVKMKTHTSGPVPYLFYHHGANSPVKASGRPYAEPDAEATGIVVHEGYQLIERFVR
ncbi:MAG TPA: phosphoglycerate mutase, partial [Nitrospiria bacterium]|nr:phosphoglycerate mutase [Nitrospiria bacterium]